MVCAVLLAVHGPFSLGQAGPDGLSPKIKARLDALYEKKFISEEDVDQRQELFT